MERGAVYLCQPCHLEVRVAGWPERQAGLPEHGMFQRSETGLAALLCSFLKSNGSSGRTGHLMMQDLPSGLLSQLLGIVREQDTRRSLFGTCKRLRDATLAEADEVQCIFDIRTVTLAQAARSLKLLATCKEEAEVKLVLQHLTIHYIMPYHTSLGDRSNMPAAQLTQQFSRLQSLDCHLIQDYPDDPRGYSQYKEAGKYLAESIQPLQTHLTALCLRTYHITGPYDGALASAVCAYAWPQLQRLCLPQAALDDKDVDALLSQAPQITDLRVLEFYMDESFADRECKWQELTTQVLNCRALATLPLAGLRTLHFDELRLTWRHASFTQEAAVAVSQIENMVALDQGLEIGGDEMDINEANVPQHVALLCALRQEHIKLQCGHGLGPSLLHVLDQLPCCTLTMFVNNVSKNGWATSLQQLSHLQELHLMLDGDGKDSSGTWLAGLTEFCRSAARPCTLKVSNGLAEALGDGWQDHLVSSMEAAGHQNVSIEIEAYVFTCSVCSN